jgi:hypothetical protein
MEWAEFLYTYKKQTGSAGQYVQVIGHIKPMETDTKSGKDIEFESIVVMVF